MSKSWDRYYRRMDGQTHRAQNPINQILDSRDKEPCNLTRRFCPQLEILFIKLGGNTSVPSEIN